MKPNGSGLMTKFRVTEDTLVIDLAARRPVVSSAPVGGGFTQAQYVLNHQVPAKPRGASPAAPSPACCDPSGYLQKIAERLGVTGNYVGLMTAVPLTQLVTRREEHEDLWVEAFVTVGVTNAVRVGDPGLSSGRVQPVAAGTINIILVTNAVLAASAMVEAVQVITESKAATMLAANVPTAKGLPGATGTGTDAVVVVSGAGPVWRYCGTHTKMGELIGKAVCGGVREGLNFSHH
jgi:iron complex transport system ATP-binding protein